MLDINRIKEDDSLYDGKYNLSYEERLFIEHFKATHDYNWSIKAAINNSKGYPDDSKRVDTSAGVMRLSRAIVNSRTDIHKAYNDFIASNPIHPEISKVTILNDLIRLKNMAFDEGDTSLLMKVIPEINKMVDGNLAKREKNGGTTNVFNQFVGRSIDFTDEATRNIGQGKVLEIG